MLKYYGLNDRGIRIRFPIERRAFYLLHVQTGSRIHPTSYPMDTGGSFPRRQKGSGLKLNIRFNLLARLQMTELHVHCYIRFHGVVLN
jgi:hypothetical protein